MGRETLNREQPPESILKQIQPGLAIEWWGRRAIFEYMEELSDALFEGWVIGSVLYGIFNAMSSNRDGWGWQPWQYVVLGVLMLFPFRLFVYEYLKWLNEIYIVCRNDEKGGGEVYKFWGVFTQRSISDPITDRSPSISTTYPINYRLWGFFTGERMLKIHLMSDNNAFIDGRRVSPAMAYAIRRVRGSEPRVTVDEYPQTIQYLREVDRLRSRGLLGKNETEHYVRTLLGRALHEA